MAEDLIKNIETTDEIAKRKPRCKHEKLYKTDERETLADNELYSLKNAQLSDGTSSNVMVSIGNMDTGSQSKLEESLEEKRFKIKYICVDCGKIVSEIVGGKKKRRKKRSKKEQSVSCVAV